MSTLKNNWLLVGGIYSVVLFYVLFALSFVYGGIMCSGPSCGLAGFVYPLYFLLPWVWFISSDFLVYVLQTVTIFLIGAFVGYLLHKYSRSKDGGLPPLMMLAVYGLLYPILITVPYYRFASELEASILAYTSIQLIIDVILLIGVLTAQKWARYSLLVWYALSFVIFAYQIYPELDSFYDS